MSTQTHIRQDSPIEGHAARWYAKTTERDLPEFQRLAEQIAAELPANAAVLEVASGPGHLALELARHGLTVTGVDLSRAMVDISAKRAHGAGLSVRFLRGNAAHLELPDESFEFVVCRAAFKNFAEPLAALNEMHRVLKPAGRALIIDLRQDAARKAIKDYVRESGRRMLDAWLTRLICRCLLPRRAYTTAQMRGFAGRSLFGGCEINPGPIGFEARFRKHLDSAAA